MQTIQSNILPPSPSLVDNAVMEAQAGRPVFLLAPGAKVPLAGSNGHHDATTDEATIRQWFWQVPNANYGIGLAETVLILDADPRNYPLERDVMGELMQDYELPATRVVKTPRGGYHFYFKKPAAFKVRQKQEKFPGIDFKSIGGYTVGHGSQTQDGQYTLLVDMEPAELPVNLMAALELQAERQAQGTEVTLQYKGTFRAECESAPPAIEGQHGDDTTYYMACRGRDLALPEEITYELMRDYWNPRCQPPWDENALRAKVEHAYRYAKNALGSSTPEAKFTPDMGAPQTAVPATPTNVSVATIEAPKGSLPRNHSGNAHRLALKYGHCLRWFKPNRDWLIWDGKRWKIDNAEQPKAFAMDIVNMLFLSATTNEERSFAASSGSSAAVAGMLDLAKPLLAVTESELDSDPYLLNCNNGVLDLKTGELRPHRPDDYITKLIEVDYDPQAEAPIWKQFLNRIFNGSLPLTEFVQRAVGCALIGRALEHKLFIAQGSGRNGKTTFFLAIHDVLGDYAHETDHKLLTAPQGTGPNEGLCKLRGVRFATTSETEEGDWLNETVVKRLTGGDLITTHPKYGHQMTFKPSHTLFLVTNFEPRIKSQGHAIWERVVKVPFDAFIPEGERDKHLLEKLRVERAGILAWLVQGCLEWQRIGLSEPAGVIEATRTYRDAQDALAGFMTDCCVHVDGAETRASELHAAYERWCFDNRISRDNALSKNDFPARVAEKFKNKKKNTGWHWIGIKLKSEDRSAEAFADYAPPALVPPAVQGGNSGRPRTWADLI